MARKTRPAKTWAEVGVANAGFRDTLRALEFAMEWGMVAAVLGREPESIDEFAEELDVSRATAFRNQQAFRRAYPMLEGPSDLNTRANMIPVYEDFVASATNALKARASVIGKVFTLGAVTANI